MSGGFGKAYRNVRDSYPDCNSVIAMCFEFPYLKIPQSAASLVLHNGGVPSVDDMERCRAPGVITVLGDCNGEVLVLEPLKHLLDRLDEVEDYE